MRNEIIIVKRDQNMKKSLLYVNKEFVLYMGD